MEHSLRFPDEATGRAALASAFITFADPETGETVIVTASHDHSLALLGTLVRPPTLDAEGNEVTPAVTLAGWHANLIMVRDPLPAALVPYEVFPETPVVVWAK